MFVIKSQTHMHPRRYETHHLATPPAFAALDRCVMTLEAPGQMQNIGRPPRERGRARGSRPAFGPDVVRGFSARVACRSRQGNRPVSSKRGRRRRVAGVPNPPRPACPLPDVCSIADVPLGASRGWRASRVRGAGRLPGSELRPSTASFHPYYWSGAGTMIRAG